MSTCGSFQGFSTHLTCGLPAYRPYWQAPRPPPSNLPCLRNRRAVQKGHSRVVITTAFPTATFLKTDHMSHFISASIPVLGSSISKRKFSNAPHEYRLRKRTYHSENDRGLPAVFSRQLAAGKSIRVSAQSVTQQDAHVMVEPRSALSTPQPPVQQRMFAHGQLSANDRELRANTQ